MYYILRAPASPRRHIITLIEFRMRIDKTLSSAQIDLIFRIFRSKYQSERLLK
jgi:hypothetical protein